MSCGILVAVQARRRGPSALCPKPFNPPAPDSGREELAFGSARDDPPRERRPRPECRPQQRQTVPTDPERDHAEMRPPRERPHRREPFSPPVCQSVVTESFETLKAGGYHRIAQTDDGVAEDNGPSGRAIRIRAANARPPRRTAPSGWDRRLGGRPGRFENPPPSGRGGRRRSCSESSGNSRSGSRR